MTTETDKQIIDVMTKVVKLGWVQLHPTTHEPYMNMADIEKTITALLDPSYMERINEWVKDAETDGTARQKLSFIDIPELTRLRTTVEYQSKWIGNIVNGRKCIMKICPFFNKEVPEK